MPSTFQKQPKKPKLLVVAFIAAFSLSLLFPVVAAVINKEGKTFATAGAVDVCLALLCFLLFIWLSTGSTKNISAAVAVKSRKIIEYVCTVPLLLIALFFIDVKLNWEILLIGLGWRFWLLVMALPYLVAAFQKMSISETTPLS